LKKKSTGCSEYSGLRKYPEPDLDNANVGMQTKDISIPLHHSIGLPKEWFLSFKGI